MELISVKSEKIKYMTQLFGSDVVSEFNMSEDDIDAMLTEDLQGVDIQLKYGQLFEIARQMRGMEEDLKLLTESVGVYLKTTEGGLN